jgi:hypothetical protein
MYWILWKTRGSFGAAFGETSRHRIARKSFGIHYGIHSEFERDIFNCQHVLAQVAITITAWLHIGCSRLLGAFVRGYLVCWCVFAVDALLWASWCHALAAGMAYVRHARFWVSARVVFYYYRYFGYYIGSCGLADGGRQVESEFSCACLNDQTLWLCSCVSLIPLLDSGPFVYCKKVVGSSH